MTKYKHLTLSDRMDIEKYLGFGFNYSQIGRIINKSDRTVAKEVKLHKQRIKKNNFNNTKYFPCDKLKHTPFVCNGCDTKYMCRKTKYAYFAKEADKEYNELLSRSRQGIDMDCEEFIKLNEILKEEVAGKGHSFAMVVRNHPGEITKSKRTIYNYIENGYLDITSIDLPRKVRYKQRTKQTDIKVRNNKIREGRTYQDFLKYKENFFIKNRYDANIVEMDTVVGPSLPDESCILTLLFKASRFLMIFKLEKKNMENVNKTFDYIKEQIGDELFSQLFQIILTDNGSEFFDPEYIEYNTYENIKLFYCDPRHSEQKGSIEVAHEYIRRYIPKGTSFNDITQEQLTLICNHINSVPRESLGGINAYKVQQIIAPIDFFEAFNYKEIYKLDIILKDNLIKKDISK